MVLLGALLITVPGCAALRGVGASADPTSKPSSAPTQMPSTTVPPTEPPTPAPSNGPTISHPTGHTDVVLRVEWGGGFVPMEFFATQIPQFTLYGDGTAVFEPLPDANGLAFDEPNPPLLTGHMSEAQMQELLDFALHGGGLADARTDYQYPYIADAGSTNFTIDAGGVAKTVSVYALVEGADQVDQAERAKFKALQQRLANFETEARNGAVDAVTDYDPSSYKVVLFQDGLGSPAAGTDVVDWPWKDTTPSDFVKPESGPGATLVLDRAHVAKLTSVPNGGQLTNWVRTPDGSLATLAVRPLLPDELQKDSSASPAPAPTN